MNELREHTSDLARVLARCEAAERRAGHWRGTCCAVIAVALLAGARAGVAGDIPEAGAPLADRVAALEATLRPFTTTPDPSGGYDRVRNFANLHVVNGLGQTSQANGKSNLIMGYNASRGAGSDQRTGSHNLITGDSNNDLGSGGLVAGYANSIAGAYATVLGGSFNLASGDHGAVLGGQHNAAVGIASAVCGGEFNTTEGFVSSISGGLANTAGGTFAWIGSGQANTLDTLCGALRGELRSVTTPHPAPATSSPPPVESDPPPPAGTGETSG